MALAPLLARSASVRQSVNAAYTDVSDCGPHLTQDVQAFQDAAASHRQLLIELASTQGLLALPTGIVADVSTAWQASVTADDDFANWAEDQVTGGCSTTSQSDPNYEAAYDPDIQATASKTAFVKLWNPLAQTYGLPTYSQGEL